MRPRVTFALLMVSFAFSFAQNATELKLQLAAGNVEALFQDDAGYVAASQPYNLRYIVEPIAIAYPENAEQISTVVKAGVNQTLKIVARSGGHSYIANGLGGTNGSLVVDLSQMKNITVDAVTGNAIIEPGNRLGDVALVLNDAGRGLPHGRCTYVGIGGHSGFGGWGFASRMWGMTLDNVLSATVVLANGSIVTASEDSNPELYWGIRGSSASFGIVASLEFRTYAVPSSATAFEFIWEMDIPTASNAFMEFQSWALSGNVPLEFGGEIGFLKGLAYGQVQFAFLGNYFGPADSFNSTIAPFFDKLPIPNTTNFWHVEVELYGGNQSVINQVDLNDTAFAHRDTLFTFQPYASSPNLLPPYPNSGFEFVDGMISSLTSNMPSDWEWGAYPNYIDDRLPDWQRRYYGSHYDRLRLFKSLVDPFDTFHFPTSIEEL
ncbi:hypothetical protein GG344DRAFT_67830 [Lentinula edodes]|nr:hypothetical protein GG344DRAFT_67830 [Lentinula edodes]